MSLLRPAFLWVLLVLGSAAVADELPPEKVAQIQAEQEKAGKAVEKKYGDKLPSELTNEERGQIIRETQAAAAEIFEKHGVSPKDFAIQSTRMGRAEREAVAGARAALEAREEAEKARADQERSQATDAEIQVIRGTTDETPMEVFRDDEAVAVERPNEDGLIEPTGDDPAAIETETSGAPEGEAPSR